MNLTIDIKMTWKIVNQDFARYSQNVKNIAEKIRSIKHFSPQYKFRSPKFYLNFMEITLEIKMIYYLLPPILSFLNFPINNLLHKI